MSLLAALNKLAIWNVVIIHQAHTQECVCLLQLVHFECCLVSPDSEPGIETRVQIFNIFRHGSLQTTKRNGSLNVAEWLKYLGTLVHSGRIGSAFRRTRGSPEAKSLYLIIWVEA